MPSCSRNTTTNTSWSSSAKKKSGIENPKYENPVATWSNVEYWRTALSTPTSMATATENRSVVPTRRKEFQAASPTIPVTGSWVRNDVPQSPCTKSPSQPRYCTGGDSLRWYSSSRFCNVCCDTPGRWRKSRSGSPRADTRANKTIVATSTTGIATRSRRPMNAITALVSSRGVSSSRGKPSLGRQVPVLDVPGEPVLRRVVLHPRDRAPVAELSGLLEQRDDGDVVGCQLEVGLVEQRRARHGISLGVAGVEQLVDLGIADLGVVLARLVARELLRVLRGALLWDRAREPDRVPAVGVGCAHPGEDQRLEVEAGHVGVEDVGRVLDRERDAQLLELRLHDLLGEYPGLVTRRGADGERELDVALLADTVAPPRPTRRVEDRVGRVDIAGGRVHRPVRHVRLLVHHVLRVVQHLGVV